MSEFIKAINEGREVQTRDGRKVRVLDTNLKNTYPIVAAVTRRNSDEEDVITYTENGFMNSVELESRDDIVLISINETIWYNVYKCPNGKIISFGNYTSEQEAKKSINSIGEYLYTKCATIEL